MGPRREADANVQDPPAKKPRAQAARNTYPRRRAMVACQLCRMRKTKCDNRRPSCGTCTSLQFQCVYQDASTDFSSFDAARLAILDRVNYTIRLIEQQPASPDVSSSDSPRTRHNPQQNPGRSTCLGFDMTSPQDEAISRSTEYTFLLKAQQLQAKYLCDPREVDKFFFNQTHSEDVSKKVVPFSSWEIREEDVPSLIDRFLENVHTKNPILDPSELRKLSRRLGENGFQATIARPFSIETPGLQDTPHFHGCDYATGESYYSAARKRIGLLDSSIIAIQCAFLIGVYEMYSMRPLRAWLSFNRACTYFQTYLHSSSLSQALEQSSETVKSRLYWSCLKSDCEIREEIALPPTELVKVEYSDAFPSPPRNIPDPDDEAQAGSTTDLDASWERSRRIANRITAALYPLDPEEWTRMPGQNLLRIAEELDTQVIQWVENFPPFVRFNRESTADELSYFLHARYLDLRERIWRPFLYLAAHSSPQDPNLPIYIQHASQCLDTIFKHILNCSIKHRQHGSWFAARNIFTKGLLVLVAAKSPIIAMPYWEAEAPDLRAARHILQHICQSVKPPASASESSI
ncbi:uncharacterized protein BDW70DRAFT_149773 [Aspergillus foveolatus]|uniref:uncharacterized protein n=1 Tax=Aspergillus foveolatus TaxID=210207 RepID=UPI003CCC9EEA